MFFSRLLAARACLATAAVVLSMGAICGTIGPEQASGASQHMSTRSTRCAKAAHKGNSVARKYAQRAAGRRPCKAKQTRHSGSIPEPAPLMPTVPITSTSGGTEPVPTGPETSEGTPGGSESSDGLVPFSGSESSESIGAPVTKVESETPFLFFSPSSIWNTSLTNNTPLDLHSTEIVAAFDAEIAQELQSKKGPTINTTAYSVPIYTVPDNQPTVKVKLKAGSAASALQSAWNAVPLPPNAHSAAGTDGHLVVWQPSTDRLWEFWRLANGAEGWHASWGGAMDDVSSNSGVYGPKAWPGASRWWGASASSLSIVGGLITLEDLERDQINHALTIGIPNVRANIYASPAQRTDGQSSNPLSLPEGAHLRLDPKLNLAALHLPPLTRMIAEAAQRYGMIVRDRSNTITFYGQDPTPTGTHPYAGLGYFEGLNQSLASFPWQHLQLLQMTLHRKHGH
jgi:hypothetical protein